MPPAASAGFSGSFVTGAAAARASSGFASSVGNAVPPAASAGFSGSFVTGTAAARASSGFALSVGNAVPPAASADFSGSFVTGAAAARLPFGFPIFADTTAAPAAAGGFSCSVVTGAAAARTSCFSASAEPLAAAVGISFFPPKLSLGAADSGARQTVFVISKASSALTTGFDGITFSFGLPESADTAVLPAAPAGFSCSVVTGAAAARLPFGFAVFADTTAPAAAAAVFSGSVATGTIAARNPFCFAASADITAPLAAAGGFIGSVVTGADAARTPFCFEASADITAPAAAPVDISLFTPTLFVGAAGSGARQTVFVISKASSALATTGFDGITFSFGFSGLKIPVFLGIAGFAVFIFCACLPEPLCNAETAAGILPIFRGLSVIFE